MEMLTEKITRAQAGVIYRAYKQGKVEMSRDEASEMYDLVNYEGYDDNGSVSEKIDRLLVAVMEINENDYEGANRQIRMAFGEKKEQKTISAENASKIEKVNKEIAELETKANSAKWSEKRAIYSQIKNLEKYSNRLMA